MLTGLNRTHTVAILIGLLAAGIILMAAPSSTEENRPGYSAQVVTSELDASVGYAPPGYSTDAQITADHQVTVTVTLVETSTVLFSQSFPAGTFSVPRIVILNGGNIFLTIQPANSAFTQMNVYARIFREITTYPYALVGLGLVGIAGLFGLATLVPHTAFGKIAGRIIPVHKLKLSTRNKPD